jgi:hypothetical protein
MLAAAPMARAVTNVPSTRSLLLSFASTPSIVADRREPTRADARAGLEPSVARDSQIAKSRHVVGPRRDACLGRSFAAVLCSARWRSFVPPCQVARPRVKQGRRLLGRHLLLLPSYRPARLLPHPRGEAGSVLSASELLRSSAARAGSPSVAALAWPTGAGTITSSVNAGARRHGVPSSPARVAAVQAGDDAWFGV